MENNISELYKYLGKEGKTKTQILNYLVNKIGWSRSTALNNVDVISRWKIIVKKDGLYFKG